MTHVQSELRRVLALVRRDHSEDGDAPPTVESLLADVADLRFLVTWLCLTVVEQDTYLTKIGEGDVL